MAAQQAAGSLPWIGAGDPSEMQRLQVEHTAKMQVSTFQLGGPQKLAKADHPRHALQKDGGVADLWYMDDGDIMCLAVFVPSDLHGFDDASTKVEAGRNHRKRRSFTTWTTRA